MYTLFKNREEAAYELSGMLSKFKNSNALVLAIPRGGIPIGEILSKILNVPLDIALTKKIGHPSQKELAIGAVSLNESFIDQSFNVSTEYIEEETQRIRQRLNEIYRLYKGEQQPLDIKDKIVIVTDDGIATGKTMVSTIRMIEKQSPAEIIIAVPVIAPGAFRMLKSQADEIVTLSQPEGLRAISQFYEDFSQISDDEIIHMLAQSNQ